MMKFLMNFVHDERGCLLTTEWVVVAMVLTLGAVAGLLAAHEAVVGPVESAAVWTAR
jgi:hypothetical protein